MNRYDHHYRPSVPPARPRRRWTDRFGLNVLRQRWNNAMPKFFKRMMWICGLVSGTALAANEAMELAHIEPHQWWIDIRAYFIAVPAGAMFACKFTQNYDRDGNPVKKEMPKGDSPSAVNYSDIETVSPVEHEKIDIEPYNGD